MKNYIGKIIFSVLFVVVFASADYAKAWTGGDCSRDSARQDNLSEDKKLNKKIEEEIEALDNLLKAKVGEDWQEILDKSSDRKLLGDKGKLGKGLGRINGKHFLKSKDEQALQKVIAKEGENTIENVVTYMIESGELFIAPDAVLTGEVSENLVKARRQLYEDNLNTLYAETLRIKKAIADGEFNKKINKVLDDYLKIPSETEKGEEEVVEQPKEEAPPPAEEPEEEKEDLDLDIMGVCSGRISSKFGPRIHPIKKTQSFHGGIDVAAPRGTSLHAAGDGVVESVVTGCSEGNRSCGGGYGNRITIRHADGYKTLYAHMQSVNVSSGQKITKGQVIGTVGSTGMSTGPHLHLELHENGKKIDPLGGINATHTTGSGETAAASTTTATTTKTKSGGGDGPSPSLAEVWRANSVSSIIQTEILLTLVELETHQLRTSILKDMLDLPLQLKDGLGDVVETVVDSDITNSKTFGIGTDEVDNYVKDLMQKKNFDFWNK